MPIHAPGENEVIQTQRGTVEPFAAPAYSLEQPIDPEKYLCGRGDIFELNFWGRQNFRLRVPVDMEGRTFLPKIGYVDIVGKTLAQARKTITQAARHYYPGVNFDMSLVVPRSFLVHVVGFVNKPGEYESSSIERVASLIQRTGGVSGSRRQIDIKHHDGSHAHADLTAYELTGDVAENPTLLDGDVITVPSPQVTVTISGAVRRPGKFEVIKTRDFAELLVLAGGYSSTVTNQLPIRVVRRDAAQHVTESHVRFSPDGKDVPSIPLQDGDVVVVPTIVELQRSVLVIGPVPGASPTDEVTSTRRLPFVAGSTLRTVLEDAGPLGASADLKGSFVRKANGTVVTVDLEALFMRRDFTADRPVDIGDTIIVPQKRRAVTVEGAVFRPSFYPYNPLFHGPEYLAVAGGPKQNAQGLSSYRIVDSEGKMHPYSSTAAISPGDTIAVPERTFSRAEIVSLVVAAAGMAISATGLIILITR